LGITGLNDVGCANEEFAVVTIGNSLANAIPDIGPEATQIDRIDTAIHEAKAVRRADDDVARHFEDRTLIDFNEIKIAAKMAPRIGQQLVDCRQNDFRGS